MSFVVPAEAASWVPVEPGSDFPIQNLPFGISAPKGRDESLVVAIGDQALRLADLGDAGLIDDDSFPILDSFIELDRESLSELRRCVYELLLEDNPKLRDNKKIRSKALIPIRDAALQVPIPPVSFIDFFSGIHHAANTGEMFRPSRDPLTPNYRWLPLAYTGRASSVVVSGTPIARPKGQYLPADAAEPVYGPTRELDFELEVGCYVSHGNEMGKRITASAAESHVLGLVLLNDWSARDVQRWESLPFGPLQAKSFATTVSPWMVTLDALQPFRIEGMAQEPAPLPHLRNHGKPHFDIELEVILQTPRMKAPKVISRSNTRHLYWSIAQQIAHLTSNGAPIEAGDLIGSGTISGPEPDASGTMLELAWKGTKPIEFEETGERRSFLWDADVVTFRAWAQAEGRRIGFGTLVGKIVPARD